jgi:glycerol-3-phosphate dehydrogenase (NAD(P)+)
MKVAILGNGGFGTALALALARAGHRCALWGHDADYTAQMARTRRNPRYLEGVELPPEIAVGSDAASALAGSELVLVAVPAQHVRSAVAPLAPHVPPAAAVVSLAKGLEQATGKRPTAVLAELLGGPARIFALGGPSHAEEIAADLPTTVVVAGAEEAPTRAVQAALQTRSLRVYRHQDVLGLELCGAVKNVLALAAGIAEGLGYGDNTKAAILARGLVEMQRFGLAQGAQAQTFMGLAGIGDLAVTMFSRHGRNRAFGERIGRGEPFAQVLASTPKVAEGVWTSRVVVVQAQRLGVEMPIAGAVAAVLFDGLRPADAVRALMERDAKAEA